MFCIIFTAYYNVYCNVNHYERKNNIGLPGSEYTTVYG